MEMKSILKLSRSFFIYVIIITVLAAVITYLINPDLKGTLGGISSKIPKSMDQSTGLNLVRDYIKNNGFVVPLQMLLFALIPIPFLYGLQPTITAAMPGILYGLILRYDLEKGFIVILSSLPHYFLELLGYCIFMALLYRLNSALYSRLYSKVLKSKKRYQFNYELANTLKYFFILVLPVIIVAAFTETYVADFIADSLESLFK